MGGRFRGTFRSALRTKSRKYGEPGEPYVIAVLNPHSFSDEDDAVDALFGTQQFQIGDKASSELVTRPFRAKDGIWRENQNTRVSAVLYARRLTPWSIAASTPELWINPWARHPLPDCFRWCDRIEPDDQGELIRTRALSSAAEFRKLPPDWPGPEEPFGQRQRSV